MNESGGQVKFLWIRGHDSPTADYLAFHFIAGESQAVMALFSDGLFITDSSTRLSAATSPALSLAPIETENVGTPGTQSLKRS